MCLSIAMNRPEDVLVKDEHAGFEYVVVKNPSVGIRCGYVKVPPDHPWYGKDYDELNCDVHGGLTFAERDEPCDAGGPDNGYWLGFDCGHFQDGFDPSIVSPDYVDCFSGRPFGGIIRDTPYVVNECKNLCEQARAACGQ